MELHVPPVGIKARQEGEGAGDGAGYPVPKLAPTVIVALTAGWPHLKLEWFRFCVGVEKSVMDDRSRARSIYQCELCAHCAAEHSQLLKKTTFPGQDL